MIRSLRSIALFFFLSFALDGVASELVLFPFGTARINGAFGSVWSVELAWRNGSDSEICYEAHTAAPACLQPSASAIFVSERIDPDANPVLRPFLHSADGMEFSLTVRELSRASSTLGTAVPVVRERDFKEGRVDLLNVSGSAAFRRTLRLYSFDAPLIVRIFDFGRELELQADVLLEERRYTGGGRYDLRDFGWYLTIDLDAAFPVVRGVERLRVQVESEGGRFWTFLTITNNETQHVTTITP